MQSGCSFTIGSHRRVVRMEKSESITEVGDDISAFVLLSSGCNQTSCSILRYSPKLGINKRGTYTESMHNMARKMQRDDSLLYSFHISYIPSSSPKPFHSSSFPPSIPPLRFICPSPDKLLQVPVSARPETHSGSLTLILGPLFFAAADWERR